ncbi:hypothetical protein ASE92_17935 [Pedobacter sp. Leaf41]|uniref:hypothetical protein n=1 Tax=Pedobacter sp. Leaf41 TaxID=1736218 RepID=UPI0007038550|nr:hypothetical protein [Pedobacter sp. Leaf41]KQN32480.1 hypothetical protein ASE92_17935 [Pedobacter sp. Leaf41]
MNKHLLLSLTVLLLGGSTAFAQQKIKDGTINTSNLPNKDAILELETNNKGLLHTRVSLIRTTNAAPLSAHVAGMMVYNLATANDVVPGIYYNDGTKWVFVRSSNSILVENQPGKTGTPGIPGTTGGPGAGVTIVTNDSGSWVYNPTTNTWTNINGPKGEKGDIGATGLTGATGLQGLKGEKGDIGATGLTGATGSQGLKGEKGDIGATGLTGATGLQGLKGDKGDIGATGLTGATGLQGLKGDKGDIGATGLTGATGLQGLKGDKGDIGATGVQGLKGDVGATGATGSQGPIGLTGAVGATGATGSQGPIGLTGAVGATGAQGDKGDKGDKGDAGATGATGSQGPIGLTGAVGATGAQGDKGDKGDKGDAGATGATGSQGPIGLTGATGTQGDKGDKGDKGDAGATGATGSQGPIGLTGAVGATGAQGDKGDKGDKGDAGATGATGSQGPIGLTGAVGATGAQGDKGDKGDKGDAGATGVQGPAGPATPQTISHTLNSNGNVLTSDVNGIAPTANIINTNALALDATNKLTSTVNGISSNSVDLSALATTANNGLTKTGINTQLGGALIAPTTITADVTNTLAVAGLQVGATTDKLVVADPTTGVLKSVDQSSLIAEPFNVQSTTNKATLNNQNIYQNGNLGLGDFSTSNPIARLDVRGAVRGGTLHADELNGISLIGVNSMAFGVENKAAGLNSTAVGWRNNASGLRSQAIGAFNVASSEGAMALGYQNEVTGQQAIALGQNSKASGYYSTALGQGAQSSNIYSTAIGLNAVASGLYAVALSTHTATASGDQSVAIGAYTTAAGNASTAMGRQTLAASFVGTAIGERNAIRTGSLNSQPVETDALFQVGNGSSVTPNTSFNNAMTVLRNGRTAIGVNGVEDNAKPTELLDLGGNATAGEGGLKIRNINSPAYAGDLTTDKIVVADNTGILKTVPSSNLGIEPWNKRLSTDKASLNTDNIYQKGNVAIGTQNGLGVFNIDAAKDNSATGTPTATSLLDDIVVSPGGRIGFGYTPSDATILGRNFDDKLTLQANDDLDVNYSLATSNNAQAIVHRNFISSGTIAARTERPNGTSIAAFEGYTTTSNSTLALTNLAKQRAGVVLRTGKYTTNGGEIWLGTSGANADGTASTGAGNAYRAIMDEKGNWSFGSDPNFDPFYRNPTQRLDLILGGVRIGALGYGTLASWRTLEAAERPNYISTDANDRVVVADANGVLKVKTAASAGFDLTNDAWVNNLANTRIELGTKSDGTTARAIGTEFVALDNGNVGIGTANPNSNFQVAGSVSHNIRVLTADGTLTDSDYTVISRAAGAINLTLPDPSTCKGRVYYIINNGGGAVTTSRSFEAATNTSQTTIPVASIGVASPNPNFGNKYMLQSDGTVWVLIQLG